MSGAFELVFDAHHPASLARFWAAALTGYAVRPYDAEDIARLREAGLSPETDPSVAVDGAGPTLWFQKSVTVTTARNRIHLDIKPQDRQAEVVRLIELGASVRDLCLDHTVMLDPEGNQFCVIAPPPRGVRNSDKTYF